MKKIIIGLLVFCCLATCLTGCGNKETTNDNNNDISTNVSENNDENTSNAEYFIKINNKKLDFPCKLDEFFDVGLKLNSSDESKLQNSSAEYEMVNLESDGLPVVQAFVKPGKENSKNLTVIGFAIPSYVSEGFDMEFNGLIKGQSTIDDVLNEFGNPEIPEQIDKTQYINTLSYKGGKLIVSTEDNKFSAAQYIGG